MDIVHSTSSHVYAAADIGGLSQLVGDYDAVMCDLWGTLHDGVALFPAAVDALQRYRAESKGGAVVLLSNSAKPWAYTQSHLEAMGLPRDSWDAIVTSGDVSVDVLSERPNTPLFHLGPDRDLVLYDAVEVRTGVRPILRDAESAEMVVCTSTGGREPSDFDELLKRLAERRLPMLCANPDLVAPNGASFVFCAGTLALRYLELGGSVQYTGKPYAPIYVKALAEASAIRPPPKRVLAIGDLFETDIRGAVQQGWDAMHVIYMPRLESCDAGRAKDQERSRSNNALGGLVW